MQRFLIVALFFIIFIDKVKMSLENLIKKYDETNEALIFVNNLVTENEEEQFEKFEMLVNLTLKLQTISKEILKINKNK